MISEPDSASWLPRCLERPGPVPSSPVREASGRGSPVWAQVSQVADSFEIGTSFSKRRSLNIFWTQCCFWHLSALWQRGRSRWVQASGSRDLLSWPVSGCSGLSVGPRSRLSTMSSRNLIIASLLISGQTFAAPTSRGKLKIALN